jgi:hypothetical protein
MELYIPKEGHITRLGDIETYNRLYPASNDRVEAWWAKFKLVPGVDKYTVSFVGNFAEQVFGVCELNTFDVDVVLRGEIESEEELKFIMDESARIGFEHHLFIDTFYNTVKFNPENPQIQIAYRSWARFYRKYPDGRVIDYTRSEDFVTVLPSGLVKFDRSELAPSALKSKGRFDDGSYIGINIDAADAFDENGKLKGKVVPNIGIIK